MVFPQVSLHVDSLIKEPEKAEKYLKEVKENQIRVRERIKIARQQSSPHQKTSIATIPSHTRNQSPVKSTAAITPNRNMSIAENDDNAYGLPPAQ